MNITNLSILSTLNDDDDDKDFSNKLAIIQGSIYIPIFCAGIANNLLTILIMLLNRDMHTVTNCYLLNLAISDTLPLIVSLPFEITFLSIKLPWGQLGCQLRSLLAETSTNASILTISAFTIERYLAVCHPLHASFLATTQRAFKIQILIWFIAILSSTPYFYMTQKLDNICQLDENFRLIIRICFYISAIIFFVLPAFILCLLYALMAKRLYSVGLLNEVRWSKSSGTESCSSPLWLQKGEQDNTGLEQQFKQQRQSSTPSIVIRHSSTFRSHKNSLPGLSVNIQSMKKSAFKMLFAVVIAFIICYAPFHVQRLITSTINVYHLSLIQRRAITIFYFISGILYYLGSTINPIFYHLFSHKYRVACLRTMKGIIHCERYQQHHRHYSHRTDPPSEPIARLVLYANTRPVSIHMLNKNKAITTTPIEPIYRRSNKHKTSVDINNKKRHILRFSLPVLNTERIRK
ncbi:unnamed protein product [Adineta steineri]|uniref:G-protein coupled receptors family 1 profile domain-containing protein n=1 Tax=Adineta steineri TaxID=433720 RepID=A0A814Q178_9BILA|nr:unnamed protein product [Adineta steineri]CAF3979429.1 unnamed protein product [Adineta steineri]